MAERKRRTDERIFGWRLAADSKWIIPAIAAIVYYYSNPSPKSFYDYTFRVAGNLLGGRIGFLEQPPSWLNEFVPYASYYYSVFPLGAVISMIPAALLKAVGLVGDMPSAGLAGFLAGTACWFFLHIARNYDIQSGRGIWMALAMLFGTFMWTNLTMGGAWQLALGFALVGELGAIYFTVYDKRPLLAGFFFALAFGNRTENLLTAPIFLFLLIRTGPERASMSEITTERYKVALTDTEEAPADGIEYPPELDLESENVLTLSQQLENGGGEREAVGTPTEITAPLAPELASSRAVESDVELAAESGDETGQAPQPRISKGYFPQLKDVARFCAIPFVLGVATLIYNFARFDSLTDFGYARIPGVLNEPWYNHGIFSVHYIGRQAGEMLVKWWTWREKFPYLVPDPFSSSIIMSSPFLLLACWPGFRDRWLKYASWAAIIILTFLLWMHGNSGGWQFGYRYAMVLLPWLFVVLLESARKRPAFLETVLYIISLAANLYATWLFHWSKHLG